jgi:hypothetical protein
MQAAKKAEPRGVLNARGPELSGYDLRETSGGWGPQVVPNRKAGVSGMEPFGRHEITIRTSHVPLYVSICRAALLRPTLSRSAYDPAPSPLVATCSLRPLWRTTLIATLPQKSILNFGVDAMEPLLGALCSLLVRSDFGLKLGNSIFCRT